MSRMFDGGSRYDVLGLWPTLNGIDEQTMISREVTDEEVLNYSRGLNGRQDPDGTHLLRKFRTNHLLSKLTHGVQQMGMSRDTFNPSTGSILNRCTWVAIQCCQGSSPKSRAIKSSRS